MTEPTAKLRLEATHVACGSPASAAAGTAVLSMLAALDVGRALHTAKAEAAARQSSSHNGQRRVRAATGPGAVLATFATAAYLAIHTHATPRCRAGGRDFRRTTDHLRQHGAGGDARETTGAGSAERAAPSAWAWWRGRGAGSDSRRCPTALLHRVTGVKTHRATAPNQHRAKAPNQATPLHASRFAEDANQHAEPTVPRRAGGIRQMRAPEWRVGWV